MLVHIIFINDVVKTALKGRMSEEENKWVFNKYLMDSIGTMIAIVICDRQTGMRSFSAKMKEWNADRCHLTGRRLYFSISYSLYIGQKVLKY